MIVTMHVSPPFPLAALGWIACATALACTRPVEGVDPDTDGDESPASLDCDDADAAASPHAVEVCDGIDNDCNGAIDDDAADRVVGFIDLDGDGFGDQAFEGCPESSEAPIVEVGGDCDEDDVAINPDAREVCNGVDDDCNGVEDDGIPSDGAGCVDPGAPEFPDLVDIITVTARTGEGDDAGVDGSAVQLCLTDARCFPLDAVDVNDGRPGEADVYHFEDIGVSRGDWDQVRLQMLSGTDNWSPSCLQIDFDGETVYCEDQIPVTLGFGVGEVTTWADPDAFHVDCDSCYPQALTHGPAVGAVGPDRARLWLRSEATRRTELRVVEAGDPAPDVHAGEPVAYAYPAARDDYTAEVEVVGLEPETDYLYAFDVDGEPGEVHRFHTAPAVGVPVQTRFTFGSCARDADQFAFAAMDSLAPDFFLFIGDAHYANSEDLSSERWFYRWSLERPARAAFLSHTPTMAVWDDHDFTGNNTDGFSPGKTTALRTFDEYWANPADDPGMEPGVYFSHRWGDLEFFMVDVRYHRSVDGTLLGTTQREWLRQGLRDSTATFKFVAGGSQFTTHGSTDSWAAFPIDQAEVFDVISDEGVDGVVFLSGDVHRAELRAIDRSFAGGYDIPELSSSPLATTNAPCSPDPEERECFDEGMYFIVVDVDTTTADPVMRAQIRDAFTNVQAEWVIALSELTL
jgi:alkaline phosphatase D